MGIIGGELGYRVLRKLSPEGRISCCGDAPLHVDSHKLEILGDRFWSDNQGKDVIDFDCGYGGEAVEMARRGAAKVVGIDIRESVLEVARQKAVGAGVSNTCTFSTTAHDLRAAIIISIDAFEHFDDPGNILEVMAGMLNPSGTVWISFGPPWYHPAGGHLYSVFPWGAPGVH